MPLKKEKSLAVFAAACLVLGMVGCQAGTAQAETWKTVEPPESGWTHEQISEVTYLCGEPFSLPCKLEDLPNDFEITKVVPRNKDSEFHTYITVNGQDIGYYDAWLQIGSEDVGLAHYYVSGNDRIIFSIEFSPDLHERDILIINGINQNSSFEKIKKIIWQNFYARCRYFLSLQLYGHKFRISRRIC